MRSEGALSGLGAHVIAEFHGAKRLSEPAYVQRAMEEAALAAGATILQSHIHHFGEGEGVTGVVLLAESHISIHTWPEFEYAALDIFMCGDRVDTERSIDVLVRAFKPTDHKVKIILRGRRVQPKVPPAALQSH